MKYTVYKITNKINDKIYVGVHSTDNPNDSYMGSGKIIKDAIKKYGKNSFIKEILFVFDTLEEALIKERDIVTREFVEQTDTYNISLGGGLGGKNINGLSFAGHSHTQESKEKIGKASTGRSANKGRILSEHHKKEIGLKNSKSLKGKPKTEEHKRKIRESIIKRNRMLGDGVVGNITDFESGDGRFEPYSPSQ